jgi:CheY-like chemotaxis protein
MPGKGGLETIQELHRDFPSAKIVAMSGSGAEMLHVAQSFGADHLLPKPFSVQDVLSTVEQALAAKMA